MNKTLFGGITMRTIMLFMVGFGMLAATPVGAGDAKEDTEKLQKKLVEQEKKAWEGIRNADPKAMKKLLAKDFMEVDSSGRRNLEESLKGYAKSAGIKTYALEEIKVVAI